MGSLEERHRKLEERLVFVPSIDEYFDASNRERVRALHTLAERLEKYGYDGDYLFVEANRRMLAEDTREWRERDQEIVEAWYKASSSPADFVTLAGTPRGWSSCKLGVVTKGTSRQGEERRDGASGRDHRESPYRGTDDVPQDYRGDERPVL